MMKKLVALLLIVLTILPAGCQQRTVALPSPPPPVQPPLLLFARELEPEAPPEPEPPEEIPQPEPEPALPRVMVALTFDDGPSPYTNQILDLLEQHDARATFFVLGYRIQGGRNTLIRAADMGSEVAGHSWNHARLANLSDADIAEQILSTSRAIELVTGTRVNIYRPPFGQTNERVRRVSAELGYAIINWTVDPLDWRYRDADVLYEHIKNYVSDGDIILLHDIYASTVGAVERAIPWLIAQGYELVTVSELLAYRYGEIEPGRIYGNPFDLDNGNGNPNNNGG